MMGTPFHRTRSVFAPGKPIAITRNRRRFLEELARTGGSISAPFHGYRSWTELRVILGGDARSTSQRIWRPMLDAGLIEVARISAVPVPIFRITSQGRAALARGASHGR